MKRRASGEGTIWYSDKRSRWIGQITLPTGKKKTKVSKNQSDVKRWLLVSRKAVQDGTFVDATSLTVETFLKRYLEDVGKSNLSARTLLSYEYLTRVLIVPSIGAVKLTSLRPSHLQSLYTQKLADGKSRRTVQYIHNFLNTALGVAYKWELIAKNPCSLVTPPTPEKKLPPVLTASQINTLLDFVKGTREYALYACAASLGMREGELLALEWSDIDFDKKTVSINKQIQYIPGQGISVKSPRPKDQLEPYPYRISPSR